MVEMLMFAGPNGDVLGKGREGRRRGLNLRACDGRRKKEVKIMVFLSGVSTGKKARPASQQHTAMPDSPHNRSLELLGGKKKGGMEAGVLVLGTLISQQVR
jgi:hypothetical protein